MNEYQQGYADNYAGVPRSVSVSREWLVGWDDAQRERLQDDREIRKATHELHSLWVETAQANVFSSLSVD